MTRIDINKILFFQYLTVVAVVSFYWVVSVTTVFVNRTLLNSVQFNLNAPFFVTWTQCVITVLICLGLMIANKLYPKTVSFPKAKPFQVKTIKDLLPLSILFVATIGFNNLCLSLVGVPFYFVSRSLTTIFNVIFTYLLLKQTVSRNCILACAAIILGFFLGVTQENVLGTLSIKGVFFGVLSSLSLSLYSIHTKKVLPKVENHILLLSFYNNLYSSFIFLPLIYANDEFHSLKDFNFSDLSFWILTCVGGVFGFLIGFASTLQIQVTSPLTHNISGTAKSCAQTVIATYWYNESKSLLWWTSNFIVLGGSAAYARFKQLEMAMKLKQPLPM
ncbi:UNVERIFIED_CONTAM: hypothetical protein PYX00_002274 [Menopon gallinae]|uniref:Sugar phosphate transporter domain-containing protein n=1 Tax=Menopon gallinae TaxID=328185 RepID=A0AAW2IHS6_9NEOP